ncbi:MAG TPA: class I SAM-dependent methyltransferase, partial [Solirubrobacteraceae bacterium]
MPLDACPWCDAPLPPARRAEWHVVACPTCGVGVTRPWPTDAQLADAYAGYRPASGRFGGPTEALLRATRSRLAQRIDAIAPTGPVLDVGAGDGTLLDALARVGRTATGLERDVRDARMLDVDPWELPADERYAAIVCWHSLEHLREPGRALHALTARLASGGVLIVAVPNWASLQARAFGEDWLALDLPRHLVHLPRAALLHRLGALGLVTERVSDWRGGQVAFGWGHGLVRRFPGQPSLYDALRREEARMTAQPRRMRMRAIALGAVT